MGLVFVLAYQHSDSAILTPVARELLRRGHTVISDSTGWQAFVMGNGPRALMLVADFYTIEHARGMMATEEARFSGIGSVSVQHGVPFGTSDNAPNGVARTTADVYCLWDAEFSKWFRSPAQEVTGNPAFDAIRGVATKDGREALLCPQLNGHIRNRRMMAMTMGERADMYIKIARRAGGYVWTVRPHPSDWKFKDRTEQHYRIAAELDGQLQAPNGPPLYDLLPGYELVCGTSTVVYEAAAFGCKTIPVGFDFPPPIVDGQASKRVADIVERVMRNA